MRIVVLSRGRGVHATGRLVAEASALGYEARVVDPESCCIVCGPGGAVVSMTGRPVATAGDVVVPRVGSGPRDDGVAVVEALEREGIPSLNRSQALRRSRDKFLGLRTLDAAGVRVPRTAVVRTAAQLDLALERIGGPPAVVKLRHGSQGVGVMLARDRDSVESLVQTLCSLAQGFMLQELIGPAPGGHDLRIVVVAGVAVAAMERRAARESFRANVHRGGRTRIANLDAELAGLAIASAAAVGLGVAGVDVVVDERGPAVLEVNASPGFEAIERVTGINVARATVSAAAHLVGARTRP